MSFVQHCFIRKNTPELCRKLEHIGYRRNYLDDNDRKWLAANHGMYISVDEGFDRLPLDDVDCGTNEELFLALAALRNDSDFMQWFICKEEYISIHTLEFVRVGTWSLNTQYHRLTYGLGRLWRKATRKEIMEHFKI